MSEQLSLPVPSTEWRRPKGRGACTRDPAAGPGTCWYWWEGCPHPEKRGCFVRFAQRHEGQRYAVIGGDTVRVELEAAE
jgi:hypothetical protein